MSDEIRVQITADSSGFSGGAADAESKVESLGGKLRDLKSEATSSGRTAKFFAEELTSIIPGAEGAAGSLKQLIAVGLSGGGAFAAFELAVAVLGHVNDAIKEEEQELKDLRTAHVETMNAVEDGVRTAARAYQGWQTATQALGQSLEDGVNAKVRALRQQADELRASTKDSLFGDVMGSDGAKIANIKAQIQALQATLAGGKTQSLLGGLQDKENISEQKRVGDETIALIASQSDQVFRIKTETEQRIAEVNRRMAKAAADANTELAQTFANEAFAINQAADAQIYDLRRSRALQFNSQYLAGEAATVDSRKAIIDQGFAAEQALREEYRKRTSAADQNQLAQLLALNKSTTDRKLELDEAAAQKAAAAAVAADQAASTARIAGLATTERNIEALQDQYANEAIGVRYAAAAAGIRAREQQETDIIREAQKQRLLDADTTEKMLSQVHDKAQKEREKAYQEENQKWVNDFVKPMESSFSNSIRGLVDGTKSFTQAFTSLVTDALNAVVDGLVKVGFKVAENALLAAAADKASNVSRTQGAIAVAVAEAAASQADIPLVGPVLAAGAAAETLGTLETMTGPLLAASGGFDVPSGVNPITQLHQREMVLPADIADGMRGLIAGGGGLGGGGDIHVHLHTAAADAAGLRRLVSSPDFVRAMREAQRNGVL